MAGLPERRIRSDLRLTIHDDEGEIPIDMDPAAKLRSVKKFYANTRRLDVATVGLYLNRESTGGPSYQAIRDDDTPKTLGVQHLDKVYYEHVNPSPTSAASPSSSPDKSGRIHDFHIIVDAGNGGSLFVDVEKLSFKVINLRLIICERAKIADPDFIDLFFNGRKIANETVEDLGMKSGDRVYAVSTLAPEIKADSLQINVRYDDGALAFAAEPTTTLGTVREQYADILGIDPESFVLSFGGKVGDDDTAQTLGLRDGDTLYPVQRVKSDGDRSTNGEKGEAHLSHSGDIFLEGDEALEAFRERWDVQETQIRVIAWSYSVDMLPKGWSITPFKGWINKWPGNRPIALWHDDAQIDPNDCPAELGLKDGDEIIVVDAGSTYPRPRVISDTVTLTDPPSLVPEGSASNGIPEPVVSMPVLLVPQLWPAFHTPPMAQSNDGNASISSDESPSHGSNTVNNGSDPDVDEGPATPSESPCLGSPFRKSMTLN
ncbi:hypothetical protein CspHIS471_0311830 [Cutaneotrichosporon sp. HIS471]|nr:hypothetical protein CspHIS471_0311830 [Cutaneotrichosporon sp. HIS471]